MALFADAPLCDVKEGAHCMAKTLLSLQDLQARRAENQEATCSNVPQHAINHVTDERAENNLVPLGVVRRRG